MTKNHLFCDDAFVVDYHECCDVVGDDRALMNRRCVVTDDDRDVCDDKMMNLQQNYLEIVDDDGDGSLFRSCHCTLYRSLHVVAYSIYRMHPNHLDFFRTAVIFSVAVTIALFRQGEEKHSRIDCFVIDDDNDEVKE